jgi:DNA-binding transcriptional LysR family regulator
MDLNKLRIFHTVAQLGRISDAASELKINQSSISVSIRTLESAIEKQLFVRHYKGMRLTREGEILYKSTKKIFSELDIAVSKLMLEENDTGGEIIISTSYGISTSKWFIKKISLFLKNNPMIRIKIIDYKIGKIESIEADVFICPFVNSLEGFKQEKIKRFIFKLFASKAYIDEYGFPQDYVDLDNHRLIAFSKELKNPFNDADSLLHIGREKHKPRDLFLEVSNSRSILEFVKEGVGIAVIDTDECLDPNILSIFDDNNSIETESYLTYRKSKTGNKKIDLLKKCLSSEELL